MSAYIIVFRETEIADATALAEYSRRNRESSEQFRSAFGTEPVVVYGNVEALEGTAPDGIVVLKFPTIAAARGWYNSEEYQAAAPFRKKAAQWRVLLVEGID